MRPRVLFYSLIAALVVVFASRADEQKPKQKPASFWMKKKLEYSNKILEGLTLADFEGLAQNARLMTQLSGVEEFIRGRNETYRHQLQTFERASRKLMLEVEAKDIDGATLAYMELTLSCVNCHKHLRDRKGR